MQINSSVNSHHYSSVKKIMDAFRKGELNRETLQKNSKDVLEISMRQLSHEEICETYGNIKFRELKPGGIYNWEKNRLFDETTSIMKDYYAGKIDQDEVKAKIKNYVEEFAGPSDGVYSKQQITQVLADVYEYFTCANTRQAVAKNNEEAKSFWIDNGMKKAGTDFYSIHKGTVYYNAKYYYQCEEMQAVFKETFDEIADLYEVQSVDYSAVEKNTSFSLDGGLSFNGVWNWRQYQTNHYWMKSENRTSIIDNDFVPPENFVYAYTNYLSKENIEQVRKYVKTNSSENKSDQDLEQKAKILLMEVKYEYGRSLLSHKDSKISQVMKNHNWDFLVPSGKANYRDYFRMLSYTE